MPVDSRALASALLRKGFTQGNKDHKWYFHKYEGRETGVRTCLSHSKGKMRDIGDELARKIRQQLRFETRQQFDDFVSCPMTQEQYTQLLRNRGVIR